MVEDAARRAGDSYIFFIACTERSGLFHGCRQKARREPLGESAAALLQKHEGGDPGTSRKVPSNSALT